MKLRLAFHMVAGLVVAAVLCGCGGGGGGASTRSDDPFAPPSPRISTLAEAEKPAQWTILVYLDGDNNLEEAAINNFNQMEMVGSTENVHVIVQMDRMSGDNSENEHWTDTRRYLITHDSDTRVMHSIRLDNPALGELDMASPATLGDFVRWGMQNFPAQHYMLVIWDHGTGWQFRTASLPEYKYVAMDNTSGTQMNVTDIPYALSGRHPDVIAFDACYMQEIEVAYQLRYSADYMVGSPAVVPSAGYNYARILSNIGDGAQPQDVCRMIVQQYAMEYPNPKANVTQSAINLSSMDALASAADSFASTLARQDAPITSMLSAARTTSLDYSSTGVAQYNIDLIDYASRCSNAIGSDASASYASLTSAFSSAVIASIHNSDMPTAHGLAIYVPAPRSYDSRYRNLQFAQATRWDEWIVGQQQ